MSRGRERNRPDMTMTAVQVRARTDAVELLPDPEVPARPRPPRQYAAAYKLRVLAEYERLDKAGKGALLRREGLYTSLIGEWRKQRDRGALKALGQGARRGRPPVDPRKREVARLRADNAPAAGPAGPPGQGAGGPGGTLRAASRLAASSADAG